MTTIPDTTVFIFGIKILEPITALTDVLVAIICFFAFYRIKKEKPSGHIYFLMRYFFLLMGFATLYGGLIGHAFLYAFGFSWKLAGWLISMVSVALLERAAIMHARPLLKPATGIFFIILNIIELITFSVITSYYLQFIYVEAHAVYGLMIITFSFQFFVWIKTRDEGSKLILWAIFFSAISAIIHLLKFSIHRWFNYLDLSHVMMAVAAYAFYLGTSKMQIKEASQK